jgi:hypothetical protein
LDAVLGIGVPLGLALASWAALLGLLLWFLN